MKTSRNTVLAVIGLIFGIIGAGIGLYSLVIVGKDSPNVVSVGILGFSEGETISGEVTIRAMVTGTDDYLVEIFSNDTFIGDSMPLAWDTTGFSDAWVTITVIVYDSDSMESAQDSILIHIKNPLEDENSYRCSTEGEIHTALATIGSGNGKIILTKNIVLTTSLNLSAGGVYEIDGDGGHITQESPNSTINILDASSVILRDFLINSVGIGLEFSMFVNETNNNPVLIDNVKFKGDYTNSRGLYIASENVIVRNCEFTELQYGIFPDITGRIQIVGNVFYNISQFAIHNYGVLFDSIFSDNYIRYAFVGISLNNVENSQFSNNIVRFVEFRAYHLDCNNSVISGNIASYTHNAGTWAYGIELYTGASHNSITGNTVFGFAISSGNGECMVINGDENTITGNTFYGNDDNTINDYGTGNVIFGNNEG